MIGTDCRFRSKQHDLFSRSFVVVWCWSLVRVGGRDRASAASSKADSDAEDEDNMSLAASSTALVCLTLVLLGIARTCKLYGTKSSGANPCELDNHQDMFWPWLHYWRVRGETRRASERICAFCVSVMRTG